MKCRVRGRHRRQPEPAALAGVLLQQTGFQWVGGDARVTSIRWIILCEGGYASGLAAQSLRRLGLVRSTDVIGGFEAWQAAGLPVYRPDLPRRPRGPCQGPADD